MVRQPDQHRDHGHHQDHQPPPADAEAEPAHFLGPVLGWVLGREEGRGEAEGSTEPPDDARPELAFLAP